MSGALSVPNTFASAVTATGAQLDANYGTITAYINDPTNRNNYAADTGSTNTVAIAFVPAVVGGYTGGLELTWKWAFTNTGPVVVNANVLGNITLVNPDGSNLQPGQGIAGSIGKGVYDGTRAIFLSPPSPATQAAMQTATASATFVTPAQMANSPGVAKVWAQFSGTATGTVIAGASYNVSQIVRNGTGTYAVTFSTPLRSASYATQVTAQKNATNNALMGSVDLNTVPTTASVVVTTFDDQGNQTDARNVYVCVWAV